MKNTLFIALASILLIIPGMAQAQGSSCTTISPNYYVCGVPSAEFNFMKATTHNQGNQVQSNWCWAACVQMVMNYHGLYVSQEAVVTRIYGSPFVNQPAGEAQILASLSGWAHDYSGRISTIHAYGGPTTVDEYINGLSRKWPLIVGLSNPNSGIGHAYVMTGIYYHVERNQFGQTYNVPDRVILRNPWPDSEDRSEMSWAEFSRRVNTSIKVWVTRM